MIAINKDGLRNGLETGEVVVAAQSLEENRLF